MLDTNSSLTQVLAELNADGTEKAYYTRGTDLISQERDGKISYYLYDGHGSVRMLADENGSVTDTYDYDAFGNLTNSTGSTANNYRYCGEQFDGTTGLYYLRARYMNPNTGTFISMDSYNGSINDPVSLHKYLYANANPVMYSDPSGYDGELIGQITGIAVLGELNNIIVGAFVGLGMTLLSELLTSTTLYEARNELEASIIVIGTQLNCKFSEIYRDLTIQNVLKTASLTADIDDIFISIKDYVKSRIDELKKNYNGSYQLHHIVAKNDYRAIASRAVIALYGIGIDSDENTILLRTE